MTKKLCKGSSGVGKYMKYRKFKLGEDSEATEKTGYVPQNGICPDCGEDYNMYGGCKCNGYAHGKPIETTGKPILRRCQRIEIKKEFYIFNVASLRTKLQKHGEVKFASTGRSVNEHLNDLEAWHVGLKMKDLDRFLRLFAYMKSVKEAHAENPNGFHIIDRGNGWLKIRQPFDKDFIKAFLPAKKSINQDRHKKELMNWFHNNNAPFFLPVPEEGTGLPVLKKLPLYSFEEGDGFCNFSLNTSLLATELLNY